MAADQAVVAVDKSRQRFFLMEKGKARDYLCTTGQAQGDKQVRGDLKTPEGVYLLCGSGRNGWILRSTAGKLISLTTRIPWIGCAARRDRGLGAQPAGSLFPIRLKAVSLV